MAGALAVLLKKEPFKSQKGANLYRLRIALWEEHTNKKGIAGGSFNRKCPIKAIAQKEAVENWNINETRTIWMKIRGKQNTNFPNIWDNNIYIVSVKENTKREERGLYGEVK
jgi:hypothetical protein